MSGNGTDTMSLSDSIAELSEEKAALTISPSSTNKVAKKTPRPSSTIHPYDVIDTLYPTSTQCLQRKINALEGKGRKPTAFNAEDTEYYILTKGFLCSIYKSIEALSDLSTKLGDSNFVDHKVYANNSCSIHLRVFDIPEETKGFTGADWLQRSILAFTNHRCTTAEAEQILIETSQIRTHSFTMSQTGRVAMLKENYIIGQKNIEMGVEATQKEQSFLSSAKRPWFDDNTSPFENYKFSTTAKSLDDIPRLACPKCNKLSHLYCAECLIITSTDYLENNKVPEITQKMKDNFLFSNNPAHQVKLPIDIELVHHPQEKITKSTGLHACLAAPTQARLVKFPDELLDYSPEDTVVLYPTADSCELSDLTLDFSKIKRAVVIEATWQKANSVVQHPKLANLPKIKLTQRISTFWRHQEMGNQFLSTLEAIYYLCVEAHERRLQDKSELSYLQQSNTSNDTTTGITVDSNYIHPTYQNEDGTLSQSRTHIDPEHRYQGEFDDLLLLYANRQQRVHNKYKGAPQSKVPKVWRSMNSIDNIGEAKATFDENIDDNMTQ